MVAFPVHHRLGFCSSGMEMESREGFHVRPVVSEMLPCRHV